ncbi:hypothetical protein [Rhodanobacter sp. C05]|uniref:hypothetical protein n=1 Tax=Rhodanobacter sp. C05 TaxID=1945855 RepID=UPI000986546F|nr:hypothetical protein [Rhodanobacter sp. C05]OOG43456.1 hypothetical protein B0E51_01195 [Rhodanobacter sp. C05]
MRALRVLGEAAVARLNSQQLMMLEAVTVGVKAYGSSTLLVTGSVVAGGVDQYSDLDLIVVSESPSDCATTVRAAIEEAGELISCFTTDHLVTHQSSIYYIAVERSLVKLDIVYEDSTKSFEIPATAEIVSGDIHNLERATFHSNAGLPESALELSAAKLAAWLWFTYARAARGEFFAAARSIDFSRENALLPLMLHRLRLPQDGHRKLESRLPKSLLHDLALTHPSDLNFESIFDALVAMRSIFMKELSLSSLPLKNEISETANKVWDLVLEDKLRSRS